jgi:hypothetical protein
VSHLSDYELEQLYSTSSAENRKLMARLLAELRELREQAGERERMAAEEREA